jgi:hypothetical protein
VRYEVTGPTRSVVFCHCRLCRVQGSIATVGIPRSALRFVSRRTLKSYSSSEEALRWFCATCGSAIYWDPVGQPFVAVFAGSLDQPTGLRAEAHIHVADRPDYYEITDDLAQYPGPMYPPSAGQRNRQPAGTGRVLPLGTSAGLGPDEEGEEESAPRHP